MPHRYFGKEQSHEFQVIVAPVPYEFHDGSKTTFHGYLLVYSWYNIVPKCLGTIVMFCDNNIRKRWWNFVSFLLWLLWIVTEYETLYIFHALDLSWTERGLDFVAQLIQIQFDNLKAPWPIKTSILRLYNIPFCRQNIPTNASHLHNIITYRIYSNWGTLSNRGTPCFLKNINLFCTTWHLLRITFCHRLLISCMKTWVTKMA